MRKKLIAVCVLLVLVLSLCALAACNNTGDGGKGTAAQNEDLFAKCIALALSRADEAAENGQEVHAGFVTNTYYYGWEEVYAEMGLDGLLGYMYAGVEGADGSEIITINAFIYKNAEKAAAYDEAALRENFLDEGYEYTLRGNAVIASNSEDALDALMSAKVPGKYAAIASSMKLPEMKYDYAYAPYEGEHPEEYSYSYARLEIGVGEITYYTNYAFNGPEEESKYDLIYMADADSMAEEKEEYDSYYRENPQEYISYSSEIKNGVLYISYVSNVT